MVRKGYYDDIFNVRLIWLASLFDVVGGGKIVFNTLTQVMIAEVVPSSYLCVFKIHFARVSSSAR